MDASKTTYFSSSPFSLGKLIIVFDLPLLSSLWGALANLLLRRFRFKSYIKNLFGWFSVPLFLIFCLLRADDLVQRSSDSWADSVPINKKR